MRFVRFLTEVFLNVSGECFVQFYCLLLLLHITYFKMIFLHFLHMLYYGMALVSGGKKYW